MPLYGAIELGFFALAFLAPALLCGYLILACFPSTRRLGRRFVVWSGVAGSLVCAAAYVAVAVLYSGRTEIVPMLGVAIFAAGFSFGAVLLGVWLAATRVFSNHLTQPIGHERPAD